jgi:hypothetical protein
MLERLLSSMLTSELGDAYLTAKYPPGGVFLSQIERKIYQPCDPNPSAPAGLFEVAPCHLDSLFPKEGSVLTPPSISLSQLT